jgi:hypothetical protein
MLRFIDLLLGLDVILVFLHLFELVTLVVATRSCAMVFPGAEAGPTEVILAAQASHVVATLVFLNRSLALRTLFCVCHNPSEIRLFCCVLPVPLFGNVAVGRFMRLMSTKEAEGAATVTFDLIFQRVDVLLVAVLTAKDGAPLDSLVIISV